MHRFALSTYLRCYYKGRATTRKKFVEQNAVELKPPRSTRAVDNQISNQSNQSDQNRSPNLNQPFWPDTKFRDTLIKNDAGLSLTESELDLIACGPKFALPPKEAPVLETIASIQTAVNIKPPAELNPDEFIAQSSRFLSEYEASRIVIPLSLKQAQRSLRTKLSENGCLLVASDKNGPTVVMKVDKYNEKIRLHLENNNLYTKKRANFNISRTQYDAVMKVLRPIKRKVERQAPNAPPPPPAAEVEGLTKYQIERLVRTPEGAKAPEPYGLVKVHKQGEPFRLITPTIGSVTYTLEKELDKILKPSFKKITTGINHATDIIREITELSPSVSLLSLDIVSMFDNVDRDLVVAKLPDLLRSTEEQWRQAPSMLAKLSIETLTRLVEVVLNNSFCTFQGVKYQLNYGVAMGGPLSVTISSIYVHLYERALVDNAPQRPLLYKRYVDDCILAFDTREEGSEFANYLNRELAETHQTRLRFTVEHEENQTINFLDIKIGRRRDPVSGSLHWCTSVYRKPTNVNRYLHPLSYIPKTYLQSTVLSLVRRAHDYCLHSDVLKQELQFIRHTLQRHAYPEQLLRAVTNLKFQSRSLVTVSEPRIKEEKFYLTIPFYGNASKALRRHLTRSGFSVSFKSPKTLKSTFFRSSDGEKSAVAAHCVYHVDCRDCQRFYIGKTTRAMSTRMKEHERDVKQALLSTRSRSDPADATTTALTQHCLETGHVMNFDNSYALCRASTDYRLKMLESINIKASRSDGCLNGHETSLPVSDLWALNFNHIRRINQNKKSQ